MTNQINITAKLCRDSSVIDSIIGNESIVGDFSRVRNSILGNYTTVDRQNFLECVTVGDYSYTGPWNMIFHCNIGKYCSISYGVTIGPPEHNYKRLSTHPFIYNPRFGIVDTENKEIKDWRLKKKISIGNDVWIGCNSVILRGVNIADGVVVGANTLVNRDVPPYAIVVGNPAKIVKYRFTGNVIQKLLDIKWWDWSIEKIKKNCHLFIDENIEDAIKNIK